MMFKSVKEIERKYDISFKSIMQEVFEKIYEPIILDVYNKQQIKESNFFTAYVLGQYYNLQYNNKDGEKYLLEYQDSSNVLKELGNFYYNNGPKQKMEEYYNKSILLNNSDAMVLYNEHVCKDIDLLNKAIELNNTEAMILLGNHYENIKEYDKMDILYRRAIKLGDSNGYYKLGYYYMYHIKNVQEGIKCFDDAVKIDINKNALEELLKYYKKDKEKFFYYVNLGLSVNELQTYISLGNYYKDIEDFEKLEETYKNGLKYHETNGILLIEFAEYYENIGNIDNMIKYYEIAAKNYYPDAVHALCNYYESINDTENEEKYIDMMSNYDKLNYCLTGKKYDKFIKYCEEIIINGDKYFALTKLGKYYYEHENIRKAEELFSIVINDKSDYINTISRFYKDKGDIEKCITLYKILIEIKNETAMSELGSVYEEIEEYDKAEECYKMYGNPIKLGNLYYKINKYDKFEECYKEYILKNCGYYNYDENCLILLEYYNNNKKYTDMIKYCKICIEKNNVDAMVLLGDYYKNVKNYDEMIKYYEMAAFFENLKACFELAEYYVSIKKESEKIEKYYNICVNKGCVKSMIGLGLFYTDKIKKVKYLKMAVNKGDSLAMYHLGEYYENRDTVKMIKYYKMSYKNGCKKSFIRLKIFYNNKIISNEQYFKILDELYDSSIENEISEYLKQNLDKRRYIKNCILSFKNNIALHNTLYEKNISQNIPIDGCRKTDFIINCDEKKYGIHSWVLDSSYFDPILSNNFNENMEINFISNDNVLSEMIRFLYTGEIHNKTDNELLKEIIKVSEYYLFGRLKEYANLVLKYWRYVDK